MLHYPILYSLQGPGHYALTIPSGQYQADLWGAVLPTSNQVIAPAGSTAISDEFSGNLSENSAYLGIPLVLILVVSALVWRRSKVVVISVLLTVSAYVLSLGFPLLVGNHKTGWHMPGGLLHHLPLLNGAVLARFSTFVFLFAALVLGVAVERLRQWRRWPNHWAGVVVAVAMAAVALAPVLPALPYAEGSVDTPSFFTSSAVDSVPVGSVAVVYPPTSPVDADSTLWQASSAMRFKMPGAYTLVRSRRSPWLGVVHADDKHPPGPPVGSRGAGDPGNTTRPSGRVALLGSAECDHGSWER